MNNRYFIRVILSLILLSITHIQATVSFEIDSYMYSQNLPLKTIKRKYENSKKSNFSFANLSLKSYYEFNGYSLGVKKQIYTDIFVNGNFIKTWSFLNNNFQTLLNSQSIGVKLPHMQSIKASIDLHDTYSIFLQKSIKFSQFHTLTPTIHFLIGSDIQKMKIQGENKNQRFKLNIDYYYGDKNRLTKNTNHNKEYTGLGYSLDLDYRYTKDNININLGIYNILGAIYWQNITNLKYQFDSQTIYLGDDGYNHLRAFGVGEYLYNITYKQKLPMYYKFNIDYKLNHTISVSNHINSNYKSVMNHSFITFFRESYSYSIGHIAKVNISTLSFGYKGFKIMLSNKIGTNNKAIGILLKTKF